MRPLPESIYENGRYAPKSLVLRQSYYSMVNRTVYLVGAGVNQALTNRAGLKPPLATDFFEWLALEPRAAARGFPPKVAIVLAEPTHAENTVRAVPAG